MNAEYAGGFFQLGILGDAKDVSSYFAGTVWFRMLPRVIEL